MDGPLMKHLRTGQHIVRRFRRGLVVLALGTSACDLFSSSSAPEVSWIAELAEDDGYWIGLPAVHGDLGIVQVGRDLRAYRLSNGEVAWSTPLAARKLSSDNVAVADGRAFVAQDSVHAVDAATGRRLWSVALPALGENCEIGADERAVYVRASETTVWALDATSGATLWTRDVALDWSFGGVVLGIGTSGDTIYVGAVQFLSVNGERRSGRVIALARTTGAELWRYAAPGEHNDVNSAPRSTGRLLLAGDVYGASFFALDRITGEQVWRVASAPEFPGGSRAPLVRNGIVYAGTQAGVYAVDLETGAEVWNRTGEGILGVNDLVLCGERLLAQNLAIQVLAPGTGQHEASLVRNDGRSHFVTSGFAVAGSRALIVGNTGVFGVDCSP
jgi:outer membrane protein assembly factor BamB